MKTTIMNANTDANEAYREARERIDKALNELNRRLREHAERQFCDRKNWGYASDLDRIAEILDEAVSALGRLRPQIREEAGS